MSSNLQTYVQIKFHKTASNHDLILVAIKKYSFIIQSLQTIFYILFFKSIFLLIGTQSDLFIDHSINISLDLMDAKICEYGVVLKLKSYLSL